MAKIFDGDEDPNEQEVDVDLQVYCPKCGAQHGIRIVRWPQPHTWSNRTGEAVCESCSIRFDIVMELPVEEEPQPGSPGLYHKEEQRPWYGRR